MRNCPACGGVLQKLLGADGYEVVTALPLDEKRQGVKGGRLVEVARKLCAVYACNACEHVEKT